MQLSYVLHYMNRSFRVQFHCCNISGSSRTDIVEPSTVLFKSHGVCSLALPVLQFIQCIMLSKSSQTASTTVKVKYQCNRHCINWNIFAVKLQINCNYCSEFHDHAALVVPTLLCGNVIFSKLPLSILHLEKIVWVLFIEEDLYSEKRYRLISYFVLITNRTN